jgi:hypothetical protein
MLHHELSLARCTGQRSAQLRPKHKLGREADSIGTHRPSLLMAVITVHDGVALHVVEVFVRVMAAAALRFETSSPTRQAGSSPHESEAAVFA